MGRKRKVYSINISEEVKRLYKSKTDLKQIDIDVFQKWYDSKNGCCDYCGLTSKESVILFNRYPKSTRGGKRGKRLELDRINPSIKNYGQDIKNLALACYWCNNAKTNYFTFEEFKKIGEKIKETQQIRINKINKNMKNQFTISSAYEWRMDGEKINNSERAIKQIYKTVKSRFSDNENKKFNYNINYRKLRGSAGRTILKSIIKRIEDSQVVIIDLTAENKNVFIESGIALALEKSNDFLSIYFIREKIDDKKLPDGIPSDLQGYFISEYILDKNEKVIFKDNNSLRMSIESDVKDYFNSREQSFNSIDETII